MSVQVAGLVVVLVLSGWAFSGLYSRAWRAGWDLLGVTSADPNEPLLQPDLQVPDVEPDRMAIVRQHANVLEELSQAYNEMANGYSAMRSPRTFQMGQAQVARASARLEESGKKGQALTKLSGSEKKALSYIGNGQVVAAIAGRSSDHY